MTSLSLSPKISILKTMKRKRYVTNSLISLGKDFRTNVTLKSNIHTNRVLNVHEALR